VWATPDSVRWVNSLLSGEISLHVFVCLTAKAYGKQWCITSAGDYQWRANRPPWFCEAGSFENAREPEFEALCMILFVLQQKSAANGDGSHKIGDWSRIGKQ